MSENINKWPHKWFGIWNEYGDDYKKLVSIKEFVYPEVVKGYNLQGVKNYLTNSLLLSSTSRMAFPCPFTGKLYEGSISFRTDGEWLWLDDLPFYIENYNVALPTSFLQKMDKNNYMPVKLWGGNPEELDWPKLS